MLVEGHGSRKVLWNRQKLQQLPGGQILDHVAVRCEKVIPWQIFELDPLDLLEDAVLDLSGELLDNEKLEIDGATVAVVMPDVGDAGADRGCDTELFVEFAGKRLFRALALFDFAARELPLQRHRLVGTPLADQHFARLNDQSGCNKTKRRLGRPELGVWLAVFHAFSVIAPNRSQT